jgi:hypothetical protein
LIYEHLQFRWDNFLLGCVICNSIKGNKDVNAIGAFMPHINNLLCFIEIEEGGLIKIKENLSTADQAGAINYIELIGLDRVPGHPSYSDKDDRWDTRLKVYDIAKRQFEKFTATPSLTDIENIVELARTNGFFSIWYYIFKGVNEVLRVLIDGDGTVHPFPGIHAASFSAQNHYEALIRP